MNLNGGVIVTDAELTNYKTAIATIPDTNSVDEDLNVIMNNCVSTLCNYILPVNIPNPAYNPAIPGSIPQIPGVIDFTRMQIPFEYCVQPDYLYQVKSERENEPNVEYIVKPKSKLKILTNDEIDGLIRKYIQKHEELQKKIRDYLRCKYVRSQIADHTQYSNDEILTSIVFKNIRESYDPSTEYESVLNSVHELYDWNEMRFNQNIRPFIRDHEDIRKYIVHKCTKNIARRVIARCNHPMTRQDYAKIIYGLVKEFRAETDEYHDLRLYFKSVFIDEREKKEFELVKLVNQHIVNEVLGYRRKSTGQMTSFITFTDINNVRRIFPYHMPKPANYDLAATDVLLNVLPSVNLLPQTKEYFKAYFFDYIECDVYYYDIIERSSPDQIIVHEDINVTKIVIVKNETDTTLSGYEYTTKDYYPTKVIEYECGDALIEDFMNAYFTYGLKYKQVAAYYSVAARPYSLTSAVRLMSMLSIMKTFSEFKYFPQCIKEYIGKCFGYVNPVILHAANVRRHGVRYNAIRVANPRFVLGGDDLAYMITMMTSSLWFRAFAVLALIVLLCILIGMIAKGGSKKESYDINGNGEPDHEREYKVYEYATGKVKCDGTHLKEIKSNRSRTNNDKSIVNNKETPLTIDPVDAIQENDVSESFSVY